MKEAKADVFELLFAEALAKNGSDAEAALESAKRKIGMDITDQELLGYVQELATKYEGLDDKTFSQLQDFAKQLSQKIQSEVKSGQDKMSGFESGVETTQPIIKNSIAQNQIDQNPIAQSKSNSYGTMPKQTELMIQSYEKTQNRNNEYKDQTKNEPMHLVA